MIGMAKNCPTAGEVLRSSTAEAVPPGADGRERGRERLVHPYRFQAEGGRCPEG